MIPPPRRAVTRFFVPLIDVLILLFCIFLLMPYVKPDEVDAANPEAELATKRTTQDDSAAMQIELDRLKRDRDRLQLERDRAIRQQVVSVLEIDAESGKLYYRGPNREEISDQAAAIALIDRQQRMAGGREVYFLILYPRDLTGYPEQRQVVAYERWFAGVPMGFNNPRGRRLGGQP